jgi:hypothetical protein
MQVRKCTQGKEIGDRKDVWIKAGGGGRKNGRIK